MRRNNSAEGNYYSLESINPMITYTIVAGGVTTQYAQKMVRLISRSKASPEAAWVICDADRGQKKREAQEKRDLPVRA